MKNSMKNTTNLEKHGYIINLLCPISMKFMQNLDYDFALLLINSITS
jgi:hypothetical protein